MSSRRVCLHFVEADRAVNDHLGGDEGVGGGCVQADNEGGEGCFWVLWPDLTKCFQYIRYYTMDQTPTFFNILPSLLFSEMTSPTYQDSTPFSSLLSTAWPSLAENCSCCAEVEGGAQQGDGDI